MHVGNLIREILQAKGMSATELGGLIGHSSAGASKILKKKGINTELLERIMMALEVNIYDILSKKWSGKTEDGNQSITAIELDEILNSENKKEVSIQIKMHNPKTADVLKYLFEK